MRRGQCGLNAERRARRYLVGNCHRGGESGLGRFGDLLNETHAIGFLCADNLSGKNELKRTASADEPRQPLRSTAAWDYSQFHFRLPKLCIITCDTEVTGHC